MSIPMIEVQNLKKEFKVNSSSFVQGKNYSVKALDDINFQVGQGEVVGLVGESGSGKTTLARTILGLTKPTQGNILIDGENINLASRSKLKQMRRKMSVIFQEPVANLNPRETAESSIIRPLILQKNSRAVAKEKVRDAFEKVKMDQRYLKSYPYQLSGGQLQRIAIARAIVLEPKIMILDEPTSALDISVQAQVLNLLLDLKNEKGMTYLIISHDLNVIRYISNRIAVMYLGKLMEYGPAEEVFLKPRHPYTKSLMNSIPIVDPRNRYEKEYMLTGEVGSLVEIGIGCKLAPRCPFSTKICREISPVLVEVDTDHFSACHIT